MLSKLEKEARKEIIKCLEELLISYDKDNISSAELLKYWSKSKNLKDTLKEMMFPAWEVFKNHEKYMEFAKKIVLEYMKDRKEVEKQINKVKSEKSEKTIIESALTYDKYIEKKNIKINESSDNNRTAQCRKCGLFFDYLKQPERGMGYVECPSCNEVVTQRDIVGYAITEKIKKYDEYSDAINEMKLPAMKIDEIVDGIDLVDDIYKKTLAAHYNIIDEYIDIVDKKKHWLKVHDMSGDILGTAKVTFDVTVFSESDMNAIKDNLIQYSVGEFFGQMPTQLEIFGIQMKPASFIDKSTLKDVFASMLNENELIKVVSEITNQKFEKKVEKFYIWSNKQNIK